MKKTILILILIASGVLAFSFANAGFFGMQGTSSTSTSYQYWRILINTANADKSYTAQYEVEFQLSGVDQATQGNAISGNEITGPDENAFDDNTGTRWIPDGGAADSETWVGQNFGAAQQIDKVRFYPEYDNGAPGNIQYVRVQADSQADFSTAVTLAEKTTMNAGAWNEITW